ncbi:MAG TPA: TetR/AcrR family transcriptional regulator [Desulfosalsimonadaceae bacterium]|nr:TetR/AcrR family transcriptional regulator [Desulfosalsimonadaceae bacterium]
MNKGARTRQYIIEKSAPVFNKQGVAGTSLADLTRATGLSKGSIYGNFRSKDELAVAVFRYNADNLARFFEHRTKQGRSSLEKLLAYPEAFRRIYLAMHDFGGCPILNTAAEADDTHQRLCRLTAEFISGWRRRIMELIEAGQAGGEIRTAADAGETADIIISLFEGGGLLSRATGQEHYIHNAINRIESTICSLAAETAEEKNPGCCGRQRGSSG